MKKIVLLAFVFVLFSAVFVGFTRPVIAQETIYIRADGSVEGTDKIYRDGDVYTFTANIYDEIVVERDNIVVDGAGYTLQGTEAPYSRGIDLSYRSHVTIKNMKIKAFDEGIRLSDSSNNSISGNNITSNDHGIWLGWSSHNTIFGNNIANNDRYSIMLEFDSNYNSISRNTITNNTIGIQLFISSNNNMIYGNNITSNNYNGIWLRKSSNNSISGNIITDSRYGIWLENSSSYNSISGNNITSNYHGIWLDESPYNKISCNNFIDNTVPVIFPVPINTWDDGYPSGGNYWSNYAGVDLYSGTYQNEIGRDGIGDTAHNVYANNTDNYPLMGMFRDFTATSEHHVQTISISSISDFQFNGTAISFNVSGENGTAAFCRICIPTALMNGTYKVFLNSTEVTYNLLPCSTSTHSYLYFTYSHSTQEVIITIEFPPEEEEGMAPFWTQWWFWTIVIAGIAVLAVAVYLFKKRKPPTPTAPPLPAESTV